MSILLNKNTRVLVQGITRKIGQTQTKWMKEYGTKIVAGVTPGRGGASVGGVPVFDSVAEAVKDTGAEASVFFVPARAVKDTVFETLDAGIKLVVVVTEHVPVHDTMEMRAEARKATEGTTTGGTTTGGTTTGGTTAGGTTTGGSTTGGTTTGGSTTGRPQEACSKAKVRFEVGDITNWVAGAEITKQKLKAPVANFHINCFTFDGTALLTNGSIRLSNTAGIQNFNSPELRNFTLPIKGDYTVSCQQNSTICNTESFTILGGGDDPKPNKQTCKPLDSDKNGKLELVDLPRPSAGPSS